MLSLERETSPSRDNLWGTDGARCHPQSIEATKALRWQHEERPHTAHPLPTDMCARIGLEWMPVFAEQQDVVFMCANGQVNTSQSASSRP